MKARAQSGWIAAALLTLFSTLAAGYFPGNPFEPYFDQLPPLAGWAITALLAVASLQLLTSQSWIVPSAPKRLNWLWIPAAGFAFATLTLLVDIASPWPADINVALPQGLFFYLSIAFVAETFFHLLPLALLLALPRCFSRPSPAFWPIAVIAALTEPAFQIVLGHDPTVPLWRDLFLAINLFVFALVQFALLRRFGLWGALGARLAYYALWHLAWGTARLPLLFPTS